MWRGRSYSASHLTRCLHHQNYIYNFLINSFIEKRSQSCALETVSLSKTSSNCDAEWVSLISFNSSAIISPTLHIELICHTFQSTARYSCTGGDYFGSCRTNTCLQSSGCWLSIWFWNINVLPSCLGLWPCLNQYILTGHLQLWNRHSWQLVCI